MKYSKSPLTFDEQASLLIERGMIAEKDQIVEKLKAVNYYRLSGYWYPFRNDDDSFKPNTTLEKVWNRYVFDRQLRLLILDAIERIEISVRTHLAYFVSHEYGAFGYIQHDNLLKISEKKHRDMLAKLKFEWRRSREDFLKHYRGKYEERELPLWMMVEVMSFGTMLTLFRGLSQPLKQRISSEYNISDKVLMSWLISLNAVRNICAHHGRLWNRELGYKPLIPRARKHSDWHNPVKMQSNRVFVVLTIFKYMLNVIAPQSSWDKKVTSLLKKYPSIPLLDMGMPENWRECPIWQR